MLSDLVLLLYYNSYTSRHCATLHCNTYKVAKIGPMFEFNIFLLASSKSGPIMKHLLASYKLVKNRDFKVLLRAKISPPFTTYIQILASEV